jgi:hypothetical protein
VSTTEPAAQQVIDEVVAAPGNVLRAADALTEAVNDRNAWRCATPSRASAAPDSKGSAWSVGSRRSLDLHSRSARSSAASQILGWEYQ